MTRILPAIILAMFAGLAAAASIDLPSSAGFESAIKERLKQLDAPAPVGLAYATVDEGKIVNKGNWGLMQKGEDTPVSAETQFMIGSISKSFTALGIMQLVEQGRVSLDAPVANYLPDFAGKPAGRPTIRQLLSHTSGFSTLQGNQNQADKSMDENAIERQVALLADIKPEYEPETGWDYSNNNYQILGRIVEVVSGERFPDYIQTNVLDAAGMSNSYVHPDGDDGKLATGHRAWFGGQRAMEENLTGSSVAAQGGIISTTTDMARYLAIMMNGEDDILSAAGKTLMMQPANSSSPRYGLGWFLNTDDGLVFHSGANAGYEALATMKLAEQKGTIVLINSGSGFSYGSNDTLLFSITSEALDTRYEGDSNQFTFKTIFAVLCALPLLFLVGMVHAWLRRKSGRKPGVLKEIGLWLPLALTLGLAWALIVYIPGTFGAPFSAAAVFQPDSAIVLAATSIMGVTWAVWRIGLSYKFRQKQEA